MFASMHVPSRPVWSTPNYRSIYHYLIGIDWSISASMLPHADWNHSTTTVRCSHACHSLRGGSGSVDSALACSRTAGTGAAACFSAQFSQCVSRQRKAHVRQSTWNIDSDYWISRPGHGIILRAVFPNASYQDRDFLTQNLALIWD